MNIFLRRIAFLACAIFAAAIPGATHGQTAKAIVLAWDGTVPTFVDELTRQGKLPNLAKLIAGGAFADDVRPGYPSKTAPGFASLMTGAPPRVAGKKVVISHIPSFAAESSENTVRFHGYSMIAGRDGIVTPRLSKPQPATSWNKLPASDAPALEISFAVAASKFFGLLVDDPADEQIGYDTLLLTRSRNAEDIEVKLKSTAAGATGELFWSGPVEVKTSGERSASVYFRLFELRGDGSDFFLYFTRPARAMVTPEEALEGAGDTVRSFIGNGASILYQQGSFGRTIPSGGSGGAEARYLETVRFAQHQLMETNRWALAHLPWDLFLAYTPFPDESEHLWRGYLDPGLSTYREEIANRLRPFLEQVYKSSDDHLGLFLANRPADTIIAVISDHGMQAVNKRFAINRLLQQKGLLAIDEQGRIDLSKSKVLYPSINNGYLLINSMDRKNGIVAAKQRKELARQVSDLLSEVRDGDQPVVKNVYDAEIRGAEMGIGGPSGGDVYIELVPGYDFDPRTTPEPLITQVEPYGSHGANPEQSSMRTVMLFHGPGIAAGHRLQNVRIIDFAPTISRLLGFPAPKNSSGRALDDVSAALH
jgi:predicted AlkP superfamily phosphohydrolase/phosphomutase